MSETRASLFVLGMGPLITLAAADSLDVAILRDGRVQHLKRRHFAAPL